MVEFNYIPFERSFETPKSIETPISSFPSDNRPNYAPLLNQNNGMRPRIKYKQINPSSHWRGYSPKPYFEQSTKQSSTWWLWILPFIGIMVLIYWKYRNEINEIWNETFNPSQTTEKNTLEILEESN